MKAKTKTKRDEVEDEVRDTLGFWGYDPAAVEAFLKANRPGNIDPVPR